MEDNEEQEGNWKRRKLNDDENDAAADESNDTQESNTDNNADNANVTQKKSDGEEKYDPLEADAAESEEDESQQDVKGVIKEELEESANNMKEAKKTPAEETWTDADNDNDTETNNMTVKTDMEEEKPQIKIENHSPQVMKTSPRGRGFMRGRGNQRARKTRR